MRIRLSVTALGLAALALLGSAATATAAPSTPAVGQSRLAPIGDDNNQGAVDFSVGDMNDNHA
ncbi:hypothetical protein OG453_43595 [Streptomyces sp. NBC_01381]|uniref:hypothetical protein n=1 Tax=Streptomyces sp. NBC_01381 TaxID=2903845 RepID=UPI002251BCAA|nr:hypothetical protein [Streptomyces sp. NBC_01381]MCX4672388.1 hypothetical protein [Streptomyces sp. NBC_01381]MCX4673438.1 hypothetical protein [Streptomyces sp. NBC_01381]MCX4673447.1 hypothetical protein [Streptomyces sp. NBC_01381]